MISQTNLAKRKPRGRPRSTYTDISVSKMQSLDRALGVLITLAQNSHMSLTEIALRLDIPTATTHRILTTLQSRGFVDLQEHDQTWTIGIEAYRTGSSYLNQTDLLDVSRPVMRTLMEKTGETVNLAIPDGFDVVFVSQIEASQPIRASFNGGTRTPLHASGIGKAILATWDDDRLARMTQTRALQAYTDETITSPDALNAVLSTIRKTGWAVDAEERYVGMVCIGAAIMDAKCEAIAGISISGPANRFAGARMGTLGELVADAADQICKRIGGG